VRKGDLVRRKFVTYSSMKRSKAMSKHKDDIGIVVSVAENACKVLFTDTGQIRSFLNSSLEVIK
jgi:exosome complex RNA-binding protein Csl4